MKAKYIFLLFVVAALFVGETNAQIISATTNIALSERDRTTLNQQLSEYTVFAIDKSTLVENLYDNGSVQFQIRVDARRDWTIDLQPNDMRSPDFRQTYITNEGMFEFEEPFVVNTFKGSTSDGKPARFTIDESNFFGVIFENGYHYIIRQASDYTRNRSDNNLIVYRSTDIISENEEFDPIRYALEFPESRIEQSVFLAQNNAAMSYTLCTYYLNIQTDADSEFYRIAEGDPNWYIRSILNVVEGVYEETFGLKFIISRQNVWTSSTASNYPYNTTNHITLLQNMRTFWNSSTMRDPSKNIAHLFTGRNLDGNVFGSAFRGHINNDYAYSFSRYGVDLRWSWRNPVVTAREIGKNLSAGNATEEGCGCDTFASRTIMCSNVASGGAVLRFCQEAIDQIDFFLHRNESKLIRGTLSDHLVLSGSSAGFRTYQAGQTISSTQTISHGLTTYQVGTFVELNPGFEVAAGGELEVTFGTDEEDCRSFGVSGGKYLSMMTYNLWKRAYNVHARVINHCRPDVVAVQEILRGSNFISLRNATGMDGRMTVTRNIGGVEYGIAMLWKPEIGPPRDIRSVVIMRLPNSDDADAHRAYIIAEFDDFCFVSTHYSLHEPDRIRMTDSIINHPITRRCINAGKPVFVAGDMNAQPFQPEIGRFETAGFEVLNNPATTDEFQVHPSQQRDRKKYKHATRASGAMIDLILGYKHNPPNYRILLRGRPYCFADNYFMVASDHYPYWVVVELK